ncbi:hypothetical protein [Streptomyces formicae]|uniref:Uncharacterized protein n=1 Tax=Streptomyces formicae TaxID=1616117 RepID=A0A291Q693_9ACTN|nr:hypothetical protein [Streptomyces formicae]ATL26954.1 hypothetical protein KY5_1936c [Streptomyces formicae]
MAGVVTGFAVFVLKRRTGLNVWLNSPVVGVITGSAEFVLKRRTGLNVWPNSPVVGVVTGFAVFVLKRRTGWGLASHRLQSSPRRQAVKPPPGGPTWALTPPSE